MGGGGLIFYKKIEGFKRLQEDDCYKYSEMYFKLTQRALPQKLVSLAKGASSVPIRNEFQFRLVFAEGLV